MHPLLLQPLIKLSPVGKTGEAIGRPKVRQFLFEIFVLGHAARNRNDAIIRFGLQAARRSSAVSSQIRFFSRCRVR